MKNKLAVLVLACASINIATAGPADDQMEYRVATIDAGGYIGSSDTSLARIKTLLTEVQRVYKIPQQKAADSAAYMKNTAAKSGVRIAAADVLDFALIACDTSCTSDEYKDNLLQYVQVRISPLRPTHQEATHALLLINYVAKTAMAKSGKK